jgi:hypothetical protein
LLALSPSLIPPLLFTVQFICSSHGQPFPLPSSLYFTLHRFPQSRSSVPLFLSYLYLHPSFLPYCLFISSICSSYRHSSPRPSSGHRDFALSPYPSNSAAGFLKV